MLLRQGLSFEDVVAQHFDDTGMSLQEQNAVLKKQKASLQRETGEQARELKEHKAALKDLLNQVWELQEGHTPCAPDDIPESETISETYRPNLTS